MVDAGRARRRSHIIRRSRAGALYEDGELPSTRSSALGVQPSSPQLRLTPVGRTFRPGWASIYAQMAHRQDDESAVILGIRWRRFLSAAWRQRRAMTAVRIANRCDCADLHPSLGLHCAHAVSTIGPRGQSHARAQATLTKRGVATRDCRQRPQIAGRLSLVRSVTPFDATRTFTAAVACAAAVGFLASPAPAQTRTCGGVSVVSDKAAFYKIVTKNVSCRQARRVAKRFATTCRRTEGFRLVRGASAYGNLRLVNAHGDRITAYPAGGGFPCNW